MFPLYNRYRCLLNHGVLLDYKMQICLRSDQDPIYIERCLQWLHQNYEIGFTNIENYGILKNKFKVHQLP